MLQGTLPQVSNRATYEVLFKLLDAETLLPVDPTGLIMVWALAPIDTWPFGDWSENPTLTASSAGGTAGEINIIDAAVGVVQILIPAAAMKVCAPANYAVGFTAKVDDDDIEQIFAGSQSIIEGVVVTP